MTSNYTRGRALEYLARDALRGDGYLVVRAAGSKGPADLLAFKPGQTLAINCKLVTLPPAEWDAFFQLCVDLGWTPLLAGPGPRGKPLLMWEILGRKVPHAPAAKQPVRPFDPDQITAVNG